jgi:hypothetical protein
MNMTTAAAIQLRWVIITPFTLQLGFIAGLAVVIAPTVLTPSQFHVP